MAVGFLLMICAGILVNYYSAIGGEMGNFQFNAIAIAFVAVFLNELFGFWDKAAPKVLAKKTTIIFFAFGIFTIFGLSFIPDAGCPFCAVGLKVKACYAMLYTVGFYYVILGLRSLILNRRGDKAPIEINN